jgi:hypothetical protein
MTPQQVSLLLPQARILPWSMRSFSLVEVDVIRLQAAQAVLAGLEDLAAIQRGEAAANRWAEPAMAGAGDLGGEDDLAPRAAFEPFADNLLGHAEEFGARRHGIHFGGVEEVDPRVDGAVHDGKGSLFIGLEAEGHGSHADVRDDDAGAAEAVAFHKARMLNRDRLRANGNAFTASSGRRRRTNFRVRSWMGGTTSDRTWKFDLLPPSR